MIEIIDSNAEMDLQELMQLFGHKIEHEIRVHQDINAALNELIKVINYLILYT